MSRLRIVTTSWDDGDPADLKIAELLHCKGLPGTFYIPTGYEGHRLVDLCELRSVRAEGFEVGGHGLSHKSLRGLPVGEIDREVKISKRILEDTLGEEVRVFCYPRGRYDTEVQQCLKRAGYRGARTTRMLATGLDFAPFEMPTSLHAYPHATAGYLKNLARARNIRAMYEYVTELSALQSWVELGKRLFDLVLREGGIWHLYGHSWEIEELSLWDDLREMLDYVCKREEVAYLANGETINLLCIQSTIAREGQNK